MSDHQYPPTTAQQRLSKPELITLAKIIAEAFAEYLRIDPDALADAKANGHTKTALLDNWRHSHIKYATSHPQPHPAGIISGLSQARRAHWECLAAHFAAMAGKDLESMRASLRDGQALGRAGRDGDRQNDVRQALAILAREQEKLGYNAAYVASIIASKFHQRALSQLTRNEVWQVVYTLRNRAAERDGRGDSHTRNVQQTRQYHAGKARRRAGGPDESKTLPAREVQPATVNDAGF